MSNDIIGINIGSKNTVIGTYNKGIFQIVLSDTSSRTIPTVISYSGKERTFGDLAFNKNRSNFKSTIIYPNRWLGIKQEYSLFEEETKYANLSPKTIYYNNDYLLVFNLNLGGKKIFYLPETIMGSFFNKIKSIWLNNNINTNNIVISIPDYSTIQERQSMLDSIYISGLNCTALLNESSAIAINYAFQKLKELDNNNPRIVSFIDFGHSQLTIFYAEFTKKYINIISVSSERFCGARDLDFLIAEKVSYEFQKKYGIDPLDSPKAKISLMNTINKIRKTLTVNNEGVISIDEIIKGKDLTYNLTREKMEEYINPILLKFENLCKASLTKAEKMGLKIKNLHSVEMVGDTLRTPCFSNIINKVFKKDLSKTLIPDECITRGCTLFAMMNSPHYKIQNFSIKHYNPYPIILQYEQKTFNIFSEGENYPTCKIIKIPGDLFKSNSEIILTTKYSDINELKFLSNKTIQEYKVYIPLIKENKIMNIDIEYNLDINCIPKLTNVIMYLKKDKNFINLNFELIKENFGLPKKYLDILRKEENERDKNDSKIKEAISYKNNLEDDIYKTRNKIDPKGELNGYYTEQEKEKLVNEMEKLMKWLYSEDDDLYDLVKLKEKSYEFRNLLEQINKRFNEWKKLKECYDKVITLINEKILYYTNLEDRIKKGEKVDIKLDDIIKIKELIQKEYNNLELKIYEVDKEQKYKMPSLTSNDLENIMNSLNDKIEKIKNFEKMDVE